MDFAFAGWNAVATVIMPLPGSVASAASPRDGARYTLGMETGCGSQRLVAPWRGWFGSGQRPERHGAQTATGPRFAPRPPGLTQALDLCQAGCLMLTGLMRFPDVVLPVTEETCYRITAASSRDLNLLVS
jgi:hypothetical protein